MTADVTPTEPSTSFVSAGPGSYDVPLEIRFLDPIKPVRKGRKVRFRVMQSGSGPSPLAVPVAKVDFNFKPILWAKIEPGEDELTGVIHIIDKINPESVYDRPHYQVQARLAASGGTTVDSDFEVRIHSGPPIIELQFTLVDHDEPRPFDPMSENPPLDLATDVTVSPSESADIFSVGGRIYARILSVEPMPQVSVRFPSGEEVSMYLDPLAAVRGQSSRKGHHQPAARVAPEAFSPPRGDDDAEAPSDDGGYAALAQKVDELKTYISSFVIQGRNATKETIDRVRDRVVTRVADVRDQIDGFAGPRKAELRARFDDAMKAIPEPLRPHLSGAAPSPAKGPAEGEGE